MWYLLGFFAIAIAGMLFVVARHMRELFQLDSPTSVPTAGEVRVLDRVTTHVRRVEEYTKHKMKPMFFTSLSQALKWAEQKLISLVRSTRKFQRELSQHAKVSPRESQYWKDISDWKATPKDGESLAPKSKSSDDVPPTATSTNAIEKSVIGVPELITSAVPQKRKRVLRNIVHTVAAPVTQMKTKRVRKSKTAKVDERAPEPDNQTS